MTEAQSEKKKDLHIGKPAWLKSKIPTGETYFKIKKDLREKKLYTVCEEAKCPNISTCWNRGTATFMIMGDTCTRACRFCHIKTGNPGGWLDEKEADNTAKAAKLMRLKHAVITMVDRDDLADGGAAHIANVVDEVKAQNAGIVVELLTGDFQENSDSIRAVLTAKPEVFAHNLETVERISPRVRDARATYRRSLQVLQLAKELADYRVYTKSAIMLGLGEEIDEVKQALRDMRAHNVDFVTIGQYLRPTKKHLSIKRFVEPAEFEALKEFALGLGFKAVASSPLVRSSYKAGDFYANAIKDDHA